MISFLNPNHIVRRASSLCVGSDAVGFPASRLKSRTSVGIRSRIGKDALIYLPAFRLLRPRASAQILLCQHLAQCMENTIPSPAKGDLVENIVCLKYEVAAVVEIERAAGLWTLYPLGFMATVWNCPLLRTEGG